MNDNDEHIFSYRSVHPDSWSAEGWEHMVRKRPGMFLPAGIPVIDGVGLALKSTALLLGADDTESTPFYGPVIY